MTRSCPSPPGVPGKIVRLVEQAEQGLGQVVEHVRVDGVAGDLLCHAQRKNGAGHVVVKVSGKGVTEPGHVAVVEAAVVVRQVPLARV